MNRRYLIILLAIFIVPSMTARRRKLIVMRENLQAPQVTPQAQQTKTAPVSATPVSATPAPQTEESKKQTPLVPQEEPPPTEPTELETDTEPTLEQEELPDLPTTEELKPLEEPQEPLEEKKPDEPEKKEKPKEIFLNFENADLASFVHYIAQLKNINLIPDPKIAGNKISLTIRKPLTIEGAWNIFLTVLEMSNFSIVKVGPVHKIIPKAQKLTEPLPTYINVAADTLPDSDLTIRFVTFLNNIPIEKIEPLLKSMLSQPSQIIKHPNANGFVITDKSYNIKSAMQVVQELDRSDVKQSVTVMKLKRANAAEVKTLFDSLMQKDKGQHPLARLLGRKPESSVEYFPPTTKIIAEERTNSLILLGDQKSIKKIEDFILKHVDTELQGVKSPIHVYELKHTDVEQIHAILVDMAGDKQGESTAAKHGGIRGGLKYFKPMKFSMDKSNNRLIVSSTDDEDWKLLKKTIHDLDKPQPQVAIETLIVSIDFTNAKKLGSQIRNKKHGQLGNNMNFQAANLASVVKNEDDQSILGNLLNLVTFGQGSTVLTFGKHANVWSIIRMLKTQVNTTVISQPFITTTNMRKASIKVGETRRVLSAEVLREGAENNKSFEDSDVGLEVVVIPQINLDGVINLDIDIDIRQFIGTGDRPDVTNRNLKTKVAVANGQILVLGGFVKTKIQEGTYKTPMLGDVPILGWLFKNKNRDVTKEYIFMFMAPTIIKPRSLPGTNLYTKMKLYQAKNDIDDAIEVEKTKDPVHNWFFNPEGETYSHKIIDFANARYQPTSTDIKEDPYYVSTTGREKKRKKALEKLAEVVEPVSVPIESQELKKQSPLVSPSIHSPAPKLRRTLGMSGEENKNNQIVHKANHTTPLVPSDLHSKSYRGTTAEATVEQQPVAPTDIKSWREEKRERLKKLLSQPIAENKPKAQTTLKKFLGPEGEGE